MMKKNNNIQVSGQSQETEQINHFEKRKGNSQQRAPNSRKKIDELNQQFSNYQQLEKQDNMHGMRKNMEDIKQHKTKRPVDVTQTTTGQEIIEQKKNNNQIQAEERFSENIEDRLKGWRHEPQNKGLEMQEQGLEECMIDTKDNPYPDEWLTDEQILGKTRYMLTAKLREPLEQEIVVSKTRKYLKVNYNLKYRLRFADESKEYKEEKMNYSQIKCKVMIENSHKNKNHTYQLKFTGKQICYGKNDIMVDGDQSVNIVKEVFNLMQSVQRNEIQESLFRKQIQRPASYIEFMIQLMNVQRQSIHQKYIGGKWQYSEENFPEVRTGENNNIRDYDATLYDTIINMKNEDHDIVMACFIACSTIGSWKNTKTVEDVVYEDVMSCVLGTKRRTLIISRDEIVTDVVIQLMLDEKRFIQAVSRLVAYLDCKEEFITAVRIVDTTFIRPELYSDTDSQRSIYLNFTPPNSYKKLLPSQRERSYRLRNLNMQLKFSMLPANDMIMQYIAEDMNTFLEKQNVFNATYFENINNSIEHLTQQAGLQGIAYKGDNSHVNMSRLLDGDDLGAYSYDNIGRLHLRLLVKTGQNKIYSALRGSKKTRYAQLCLGVVEKNSFQHFMSQEITVPMMDLPEIQNDKNDIDYLIFVSQILSIALMEDPENFSSSVRTPEEYIEMQDEQLITRIMDTYQGQTVQFQFVGLAWQKPQNYMIRRQRRILKQDQHFQNSQRIQSKWQGTQMNRIVHNEETFQTRIKNNHDQELLHKVKNYKDIKLVDISQKHKHRKINQDEEDFQIVKQRRQKLIKFDQEKQLNKRLNIQHKKKAKDEALDKLLTKSKQPRQNADFTSISTKLQKDQKGPGKTGQKYKYAKTRDIVGENVKKRNKQIEEKLKRHNRPKDKLKVKKKKARKERNFQKQKWFMSKEKQKTELQRIVQNMTQNQKLLQVFEQTESFLQSVYRRAQSSNPLNIFVYDGIAESLEDLELRMNNYLTGNNALQIQSQDGFGMERVRYRDEQNFIEQSQQVTGQLEFILTDANIDTQSIQDSTQVMRRGLISIYSHIQHNGVVRFQDMDSYQNNCGLYALFRAYQAQLGEQLERIDNGAVVLPSDMIPQFIQDEDDFVQTCRTLLEYIFSNNRGSYFQILENDMLSADVLRMLASVLNLNVDFVGTNSFGLEGLVSSRSQTGIQASLIINIVNHYYYGVQGIHRNGLQSQQRTLRQYRDLTHQLGLSARELRRRIQAQDQQAYQEVQSQNFIVSNRVPANQNWINKQKKVNKNSAKQNLTQDGDQHKQTAQQIVPPFNPAQAVDALTQIVRQGFQIKLDEQWQIIETFQTNIENDVAPQARAMTQYFMTNYVDRSLTLMQNDIKDKNHEQAEMRFNATIQTLKLTNFYIQMYILKKFVKMVNGTLNPGCRIAESINNDEDNDDDDEMHKNYMHTLMFMIGLSQNNVEQLCEAALNNQKQNKRKSQNSQQQQQSQKLKFREKYQRRHRLCEEHQNVMQNGEKTVRNLMEIKDSIQVKKVQIA